MKKFVIISLSFFYLVIASGVFVNLHYCGGKIKKISFFHISNEDGCCGSEEESDGCCKNKASFIKIKDNHHSNSPVKLADNRFKCNDFINPETILLWGCDYPDYKQIYHDPPIFYHSPIYLKHKVLII